MTENDYSVDFKKYNTAVTPKHKSKLVINHNFQINFYCEKPNWFWRMWQYLLLGFRWEDVK